MKFSIIPALVALLRVATPVMAAPSAFPEAADVDVVDVDDISPGVSINEAEVFAIVAPPGCSILSCVKVIGQAVCIVGAISTGNVAALLACGASKKQLCKCAGCYNDLEDFLQDKGIC
ncbi:hypothetical protein QBC37DRAFT_399487 [Rhypophila decipiens]|uniref:Uncharacterized protein n=1 Tax=Rhypophila decipiens TaxID=261697 RepID=A0AAN7B6K0_9PEZI|nr:hypothetical protein QBC37DRAFT_399487 [Rhypophila decipiens]